MATIDLSHGSGTQPSRHGNTSVPKKWTIDIDFADAVTKKGSALVEADTLTAFNLPADTLVTVAGFKVLTATDSTDLKVAVNDGTNDLVAATVLNGVTAGTYATGTTAHVYNASKTVHLVLSHTTAFVAPTVGKLRVFLIAQDVTEAGGTPGIAVSGS